MKCLELLNLLLRNAHGTTDQPFFIQRKFEFISGVKTKELTYGKNKFPL